MTDEELSAILDDLSDQECRNLIAYLNGHSPSAFAPAFAQGIAFVHKMRTWTTDRLKPVVSASEPAPVATSAILRSAAQLIRAQAPTHVSVTTAVRIAAGSGREAHEQAETVLAWLVEHLEYDDPRDLDRWDLHATREQVLDELGRAANAAERTTGTSSPAVRGGPTLDPATEAEYDAERDT